MANVLTDKPFTSSPSIKAAFLDHLKNNPNSRRVSRIEREELIEWLADRHAPPSSQKEFSRRNYVRKIFVWDASGRTLAAVAKNNGGKDREVVIEDNIMDVVELVHTSNGHAGWDATWRDVSSSYYGILRADVIFLLKRCGVCALNPRKRPKRGIQTAIGQDGSQLADGTHPNLLNDDSLFYDFLSSAVSQDRSHAGE
ncbi:hypothetical protein QBC44DRAFT_321399 [Cladorrhinum sp. PSN332]|nr:hypothetical protein QBC44DRAFT_321399 [Cladorrhinum sp. PSN332]